MSDLMKNRIVFVDTNVVDGDKSFNHLLGNRRKLTDLAKSADLVIPKVVIDELINHKLHIYQSEKSHFVKSPFFSHVGIETAEIEKLEFESIKKQLLEDQSIPYKIASINKSKEEAFNKIYSLAIRNLAPFDKGSDKGFKDACIAICIECYLANEPNHEAFLITKDSRLSEYFASSKEIEVVNSETSILANSRRKATLSAANSNSNAQSPTRNEALSARVDQLCNSKSFEETHYIVGELAHHLDELGLDSINKIIESTIENNQISWIASDPDVREFIIPLFLKVETALDDRNYAKITDLLLMPNNRKDEYGRPQYSRQERASYEHFADALISHIGERHYLSSINTDPENIKAGLSKLLSDSSLDPKVSTWQDLANLFFDKGSYASTAPIDQNIVKDFLSLLKTSSDEKAGDIIESLKRRLESIEIDYPF